MSEVSTAGVEVAVGDAVGVKEEVGVSVITGLVVTACVDSAGVAAGVFVVSEAGETADAIDIEEPAEGDLESDASGDTGEEAHAAKDNIRSRQTASQDCQRFFKKSHPLPDLCIA